MSKVSNTHKATMGGCEVLREFYLPPGQVPLYTNPGEFAWELPAKPGRWLILAYPANEDETLALLQLIVGDPETDDTQREESCRLIGSINRKIARENEKEERHEQ